MQVLAPIAITGVAFEVELEGTPKGILTGTVKLDNESPYLLQLTLGGDQHYLNPWMANVYEVPSGSNLRVSPIVLTALAGPPSSSLLVTVASAGETIPGTYPATLTAQVSTYTPATAGSVITVGTSFTGQDITVPVGTVAAIMRVDLITTSDQLDPANPLTVYGDQSHRLYLLPPPLQLDNTRDSGRFRNTHEYPFLLDGIDTSFTLAGKALGGSLAVQFSFLPYLIPIRKLLEWWTAGEPAAGANATATATNRASGPQSGTLVLDQLVIGRGGTGTSGAIRVEVRDASGTGTVLWNTTVNDPGDADAIHLRDLGVVGVPGENLVALANATAGNFADVAIATYYESQYQ